MSNLVIAFEHSDPFMDDINSRQEINSLADFLLKHEAYFQEFVMIVKQDVTLARFEDWKLNFMLRKGVKTQGRDYQFVELLEAVYNISKEPDEVHNEHERLGIVRGSVFEVYIRKIIERRYNDEIHTNCRVKVDGNYIKSIEHGDPQTLDVGLYNKKIAEMYECKVSCHRFKYPKLSFLKILTNILNEFEELESLVAGISMSDQKALERQFNINKCKNVACFGRANIIKIKNINEALEFAKLRVGA